MTKILQECIKNGLFADFKNNDQLVYLVTIFLIFPLLIFWPQCTTFWLGGCKTFNNFFSDETSSYMYIHIKKNYTYFYFNFLFKYIFDMYTIKYKDIKEITENNHKFWQFNVQ